MDRSFLEKELGGTGVSLFLFDEIDSTNSEAKRRIREGFSDTALFCAERQSGGRGRLGRSFFSPAGTGIYMTLAVPVDLPFSAAVRMTAKASVAVLRGLDRFLPGELTIKWVNDLYLADRKVAGILVEAVADETNSRVKNLVVGVGINVSTEAFPEELREKAGSLKLTAVSHEAVTGAITKEVLRETENFSDLSYLNLYRSRSCVLGREILYGMEPDFQKGFAESIDDMGRLVVITESGESIALETGEVSVRFI